MEKLDNANLIQLITTVFRSENNQERQKAEEILSSFIAKNPSCFITECCQNSFHEQLDTSKRLLLITTISMSMKIKDRKCSDTWISIPHETKQILTKACLSNLIDKSKQVRHSAANLTGLVFVSQILLDPQSIEILVSICSNISSTDPIVRGSSVVTLGTICDLLQQIKIDFINNETREILFKGLFNSLSFNNENSLQCVKSLNNSLNYIKPYLTHSSTLEYILEKLILLTDFALNNSEKELLIEIINCFLVIVKLTYPLLEKYHVHIFDKLCQCFTLKDKTIRNCLYEFFGKCFRLERIYKKGFLSQHWRNLTTFSIEQAFEFVKNKNYDRETKVDFLQNTSDFLAEINSNFIAQNFECLLIYVKNGFETSDPDIKCIGIIILISLLESCPNQPILLLFNENLSNIMSYIKLETQEVLRIVSLSCLVKTAEFHPNVIINPTNFTPILFDFFALFRQKNDSEMSVIVKTNICQILIQITEKSIDNTEFLNFMKSYASNIFECALEVIGLTNNPSLFDLIFTLLYVLADVVLQGKSLIEYFKIFVDFLKRIEQNYSSFDITIVYCNTLILINALLSKLKRQYSEILEINEREILYYLKDLYTFLVALVLKYPIIKSEGFHLIGTIILSFPHEFKSSVIEYYELYIKKALSDPNEPDTMRIAMHMFTSFVKIFPELFEHQLIDFIEYIFIVLKQFSEKLDLNLKYGIIVFMSDVIVFRKHYFLQRIDEWIKTSITFFSFLIDLCEMGKTQKDYNNSTQELCRFLIDNMFVIVQTFYLEDQNYDQLVEGYMIEVQKAFKILLTMDMCFNQNFEGDVLVVLWDFYSKKKFDQLIDASLIYELGKKVDYQHGEKAAQLAKKSFYARLTIC